MDKILAKKIYAQAMHAKTKEVLLFAIKELTKDEEVAMQMDLEIKILQTILEVKCIEGLVNKLT